VTKPKPHNSSRVAVVTGATGGIGSELADQLAAQNWTLVLVNRSRERSESLLAELKRSYPAVDVTLFYADLLDVESIREVVKQITEAFPSIDLLVNNAGLLSRDAVAAPSGLDHHAQVNTIAPILLTFGLRGSLKSAAMESGRSVAITTSSGAISMGPPLVADELRRPTKPGLFGSYPQSKLAAAVAYQRLADEFLKDGIELYSIDPGGNRTAMTSGPAAPFFVRWGKRLLPHPRVGASKLLKPIDTGWDIAPGSFVSGGKAKALPRKKLTESEIGRTLDLIAEQVARFDPDIDASAAFQTEKA